MSKIRIDDVTFQPGAIHSPLQQHWSKEEKVELGAKYGKSPTPVVPEEQV